MTNADQKIPTIREQTLEHIARHLGDHGSGPQIVGWLQSWGVPNSLIEYPNTKWRMVYAVLSHYAYSTENKDREMLFKIIGEMLHPIMYNGDKQAAETAAKDFNNYLEYDRLAVLYSDADKEYGMCKIQNLTEADKEELILEANRDLFEQDQEELQFLRLQENKERISTLRKAYQVFMNIVEVFCDNPSKPSHELNDAYVKTKELITNAVGTLHLYADKVNGTQRIHTLTHYCIPFNNLFTAEAEYKDRFLEKVHWDAIRPKMHATYGCIDELYREVDGSDVLSKPNVQQTLNDVSLLLSKTKEENKKLTEVKQNASTPQIPVQKIEITAIPEVVFRNAQNNTPAKGKKPESGIDLSFPEPVKWDKVALKIKEGRKEVEIFYGNSHIITADYKQLRFFVGKRQQKPDRQWGFLCALSALSATDIQQATAENMRYMIVENKTLSANNVQQIKKSLAERLQDVFKTSDDPFHDRRDYYEPKFALLPEPVLRQEEIRTQGGKLNENRACADDEEEAL